MIFKSQQPDIDLPETDLTSVVFGRVDELGDKPALIEGTTGRTLTYNQLREQTNKFSAGLNACLRRRNRGPAVTCSLESVMPVLASEALPELAPESVGMLKIALWAYVAILFGVSLAAARKVKTEADYLIAGRNLPLVLAWGTLMATWFGAATMFAAADASRCDTSPPSRGRHLRACRCDTRGRLARRHARPGLYKALTGARASHAPVRSCNRGPRARRP